MQYFSIYAGSFSIDDEPADEVCDQQSPSQRGSSNDGVGDDMTLRGRSRWGSREAARAGMGLDRCNGNGAQWRLGFERSVCELIGFIRYGDQLGSNERWMQG
jgi:hypothetical protein